MSKHHPVNDHDTDELHPVERSTFWRAYGHISALLGAFSAFVFVGHFVDVGLHGIIREAIEIWTKTVRPVLGSLVEWLCPFELSPFWKDYLIVGVMLAASSFRVTNVFQWPWEVTAPRDTRVMKVAAALDEALRIALGLLLIALFWPLVTLVFVAAAFSSIDRRHALEYLSPLIYLALIFAINWLLPFVYLTVILLYEVLSG